MSDLVAGLAQGVLDGALTRILREMEATGVADPGPVVRAALAAGEEAVRCPLLAWGAGVDPLAILWAREVRSVLIVANVVGDEAATVRALHIALDVALLSHELAALA